MPTWPGCRPTCAATSTSTATTPSLCPTSVVAIASCAIPTITIPATRRSRPTHSYGMGLPGAPVWTPGALSCWGLCLRQPVVDHAQESSVSCHNGDGLAGADGVVRQGSPGGVPHLEDDAI